MTHRQLGHGVGGGSRRILHRDARLFGVLHVDVVHAYAAADDQLQSPGFGFVNVVGTNLRGAAHHHGVIFFQGCAQLFGGVKLLGHLVAVVFQLLQGGFIHTVGD